MKKKLNKYCLIFKIKPEHIDDYIEIHKNAWSELLKAGREAGAKELFIFFYNNMSIVNFECEDIDQFYRKYGEYDCVKRWNGIVLPWIETAPSLDGSNEVDTIEKIFDLNEQLDAVQGANN